jgi:hypothetical protein
LNYKDNYNAFRIRCIMLILVIIKSNYEIEFINRSLDLRYIWRINER